MGSPDELADALWAAPVDDADWFRTCTLTELRTLAREAYRLGKEAGDYHEGWEEGYKSAAREAAKEALLEAAEDWFADTVAQYPEDWPVTDTWLRARAEQIGKETDG